MPTLSDLLSKVPLSEPTKVETFECKQNGFTYTRTSECDLSTTTYPILPKYGTMSGRVYTPNTSSPQAINFPTLPELGVKPQDYIYIRLYSDDYSTHSFAHLIQSTTDSVTEPTKMTTIHVYTCTSEDKSILDSREATLLKGYNISNPNTKPVNAELDYGANKAYWLKDCLVLRYDTTVLNIHGEPSRDVINTPVFADAVRQYHKS